MKIGEFFEKHVQWIALGLAAVWLLWVGWTYGVNRPEVELGGTKFSAGSVDEHIRDTDMNALAAKLGNSNVPAMDVPDFTEAFASAMNGQPPTQVASLVWRSDPQYSNLVEEGGSRSPRERWVVNDLPKVVVPTDLVVLTGRSLLAKPENPPAVLLALANNKNNPANNADNGNGGNQTIFNENNAIQTQPAAGAAGGGAAGAVAGQQVAQFDKPWETVFAKLNFNEQDKEFARVKLPPYLMGKQYIEVQLQRQEVLPDGTFGEIQLVQGLPINKPPVDRKNPAEFIKWSADPEAQKIILAPPFYNVIKGTSWEVPHKDVPQVAQAQDQQADFNLQQKYQEYKGLKQAEKNKFTDGWTPEQKRAFYNFRIEEEKKENAAKNPQPRQNQPSQRGYVPPRGGPQAPPSRQPRSGEDAVDPQLLREMFADGDPSPARRRTYSREYEGPRRRYEGDYRIQPFQDQVQQPGQQILVNLVPDANGNVDIWAHDETALPGRTYRYRLRAIIKNPLFDTNIGSKPELNKPPYLPADTATAGLDMTSAWSAWSKSVAIPTNIDMMLVSAQTLNGRELARFRVQAFKEGQTNEAPKPFEVAPGDTIGGREKVAVAQPNPNGGVAANKQIEVDFTTKWMLVDIRQTGNDYRVRIMDADGRMETRTVTGDRGKFKDTSTPKPTAGGPGNTTVGLVRPTQN